jgi:hypothetical protein
MFPNTASPATAATIAAMMDDEDLSAANARRLAHDARVARRGERRRKARTQAASSQSKVVTTSM